MSEVILWLTWILCFTYAAACNGQDKEDFIMASQHFFNMSIRPDLIKNKNRTAAMGFEGSGDFLTIKGREKIVLRAPAGYVFVTKQICMNTKDVRHILLHWRLNGKLRFTQRLFPMSKSGFDKKPLCFKPRRPEATRANELKMMFRKTQAGDTYMSIQSVALLICVPIHEAVEEVSQI